MALSLEAIRVSGDSLPVISVEGLSSSKLKERQDVASMLREACLDKGFFYISNHGISLGLIDAVFKETKRLFDLTDEAKAAVDMSHSICHRGYERLRAQTLEAGAPPDLKEGFYVGPDLPLDDPRVIAQQFQCGPNLWPQDMPAFRPTMQAYFAAMLDLSHRLMRGLALSLDRSSRRSFQRLQSRSARDTALASISAAAH
jgi:isopenicillin N synthase-like dioxygenase